MTDSEWQTIYGTLMTSEPIDAYSGVSIPTEMLRSLAQQINTGGIPWHMDHDLSKPIRIRSFEAFVESRRDGIDELRFRAELHEEDVQWLESRPGMSTTLATPLARDQNGTPNDGAMMRLSADHAWFADDALIEAEEQLIMQGVGRDLIQVERAYQFGFMPDPQIFIEIVYPFLQSMAPNVVWDGIKKLFSQRRTPIGGNVEAPTVINMSIVDGDRSLTAVVTTNDETVAQHAIGSLNQAVTAFFQSSPVSPPEAKPKSVTVWDDARHNWTPPA
ncbi:hypothetical protein [Arthrobacter sp. Y81]|uniref:hypothetical protein n=1 Tax=Arthrobacter sp. Y81 TaxID=2058897 RepID=UPI000CE31D1C|nr:hypothetical protein [Arthrobacter sp. Y81]